MIESHRTEGVNIRIGGLPERSLNASFDFCLTNMDSENDISLLFDTDWRKGKEIRQIVMNVRFYQVSPSKTKLWFSNFETQVGTSNLDRV